MTKKQATSEEERIAAWRAERARIAAADKAARVSKRQAEQSRDAETSKNQRHASALTLLRSVDKDDATTGDVTKNTVEKPRETPNAEVVPLIASRPETPAPKPAPKVARPPSHVRAPAPPRKWPLFVAMVIAPVVAAAVYLLFVATPLYEAQSVIAITKSHENTSGGSTGLLGNSDGPSNLSEVFRADQYINSQALMDSLEAELGLVSMLSGDAIDPLRRLRTVPVLSWSKKMQFDRFIESSVDIRSELMTLYVRAPSKEQAIDVSQAVLRNAEFQVSQLGEQLFENRQSFAANLRRHAEEQVAEAQAVLVELQMKNQEVDPSVRVATIYSRIKDLETQAQELRNQIQTAEISGLRNSTRTATLKELEVSLKDQIAFERSRLVGGDGSSETPLNDLLMEYELATLNVELGREAVRAAIEAQAEAGREAALNRSLFQVVVPPRTAQTAIYPKVPGILALIFIVCLTAYAAVTTLRGSRS